MHVVGGAAQYSILMLELIYYIISEMLIVFTTTPYDKIVCQWTLFFPFCFFSLQRLGKKKSASCYLWLLGSEKNQKSNLVVCKPSILDLPHIFMHMCVCVCLRVLKAICFHLNSNFHFSEFFYNCCFTLRRNVIVLQSFVMCDALCPWFHFQLL